MFIRFKMRYVNNVVLHVNMVVYKKLGEACVESKYLKNVTFDQNETNTIEIYTLCPLR